MPYGHVPYAPHVPCAPRQRHASRPLTGLTKLNFFIGVVNVGITGYFIGKWPQHYWVFAMCKAAVLLPLRTYHSVEGKQWRDMFEFCWVANYTLLAMYLMLFAMCFCPETLGLVLSPETRLRGFYIFFAFAVGPLGGSVTALRNALIFHSVDHMAALFIHASPLLCAWCIKVGDPEGFTAAYPQLLAGIATPLHTDPIHDIFLTGMLACTPRAGL